MTLLAKILWFLWTAAISDLVIDWTGKISNKKLRLYVTAVLGLTVVVTIIAIALIPFVNLLWK